MTALSSEHQQTLLATAFNSIKHSLTHDEPMEVNPENFSAELKQLRATFVTLKIERKLRGCIGMLEAVRPLIVDVVHNAHAAAFSDPRFAPLSSAEFALLDMQISILNPAKEIQFTSQEHLISQLHAGKDGLILEEGRYYRSTFLPGVWNSLPDPQIFLRQLKQKAGLTPDYWSDTVRIYRYTTESIPQDE